MELATIISQYLKENRRLVIPQLGAFLVKEPDQRVVFSSLLTRDDGILRQLIVDSGVGELQANGLLDRLLFDIRYVAENGGEFILDGVGRFGLDPHGQLHFVSDRITHQSLAKEDEASEAAEAPNPFSEFIAAQTQEVVSEPVSAIEPAPEIAPEPAPGSAPEKVSEPAPESAPEEIVVAAKPRHAAKASRGKRKPALDIWMIIGVAAVVLALGAILYGFLREGAEPISLFGLFE